MARKSGQAKRYRYRTNKQDFDWREERAEAANGVAKYWRRTASVIRRGWCWVARSCIAQTVLVGSHSGYSRHQSSLSSG